MAQNAYNKQTLMPMAAYQTALNQVYSSQREKAFQEQIQKMKAKNAFGGGQIATGGMSAANSTLSAQQLQYLMQQRTQQMFAGQQQQQQQRIPSGSLQMLLQSKQMGAAQQVQATPTPALIPKTSTAVPPTSAPAPVATSTPVKSSTAQSEM